MLGGADGLQRSMMRRGSFTAKTNNRFANMHSSNPKEEALLRRMQANMEVPPQSVSM